MDTWLWLGACGVAVIAGWVCGWRKGLKASDRKLEEYKKRITQRFKDRFRGFEEELTS